MGNTQSDNTFVSSNYPAFMVAGTINVETPVNLIKGDFTFEASFTYTGLYKNGVTEKYTFKAIYESVFDQVTAAGVIYIDKVTATAYNNVGSKITIDTKRIPDTNIFEGTYELSSPTDKGKIRCKLD